MSALMPPIYQGQQDPQQTLQSATIAQAQHAQISTLDAADDVFVGPVEYPSQSNSIAGAPYFSSCHLGDILLQIALGHSLKASHSLLTTIPCEILQLHIARHVRALYEEDLTDRGLLTPVQTPADCEDAFAKFEPPKPITRRLQTCVFMRPIRIRLPFAGIPSALKVPAQGPNSMPATSSFLSCPTAPEVRETSNFLLRACFYKARNDDIHLASEEEPMLECN
jgi:hypothetical protein